MLSEFVIEMMIADKLKGYLREAQMRRLSLRSDQPSLKDYIMAGAGNLLIAAGKWCKAHCKETESPALTVHNQHG